MSGARYFLRSCERACADIPLVPEAGARLGRGPLTGITDTRVSRLQAEVTVSGGGGVTITQRGPNHSVVTGKELRRGEGVSLSPGDTIELLEGLYKFQLLVNNECKSDKNEENEATDPAASDQKSGHWSKGLLGSMQDPEFIVHSTDSLVIIRDKYPKAKHHFLILPRKSIAKLKNIGRGDLSVLTEMDSEARKLIKRYPDSEFNIGYHAVPSMSQVHLHVISSDFISPCLKHKKHWNSFNTDYFIPSTEVIERIESEGKYLEPSPEISKQLLNTPLKCSKCEYVPTNFPTLKQHLLTHQ